MPDRHGIESISLDDSRHRPNSLRSYRPRIARLMAQALHCEKMVREKTIPDQTELARFGHISKSRMTQIMAMLNLATDIQEEILFLPRIDPSDLSRPQVQIISLLYHHGGSRSPWVESKMRLLKAFRCHGVMDFYEHGGSRRSMDALIGSRLIRKKVHGPARRNP